MQYVKHSGGWLGTGPTTLDGVSMALQAHAGGPSPGPLPCFQKQELELFNMRPMHAVRACDLNQATWV